MEGPDMENRDPKNMNDHVKVMFEDVLAEPEGAHSAECVWRCAYNCFNGGKRCCYLTLTYLCAIPIALCWGCEFACISFCHIWKVTPCIRCCAINIGCMQKLYGIAITCCLGPLCETFGLFFSKIFVTNGPMPKE